MIPNSVKSDLQTVNYLADEILDTLNKTLTQSELEHIRCTVKRIKIITEEY